MSRLQLAHSVEPLFLRIDDIVMTSEALVKRAIEIIVSIIALFVVWNEWSDSGVI